ncbi:MAG: DUF3631 domain-containing protein, partial [Actinomycetota bacterium]
MSADDLLAEVLPPRPSLAGLLEDVGDFGDRFVSFANVHQRAAFQLFIAHVYAIDAAPAAAYMRVTSAAEESGKTTTLEVIGELLGDRALNAMFVSPAGVFRARDKLGPVTLLLDEIDNTLKDRKDDGARDLLALVNGGYRRSAKVIRTVGQNHDVKVFPAFGPAVIAGLGTLHPTTESRCIPIVLERKMRGSGERWLPHLLVDEIASLRRRLVAWASDDTIARLRVVRPMIPPELRDRHAEVWWGMFAIADEAGAGWPQRARTAALTLHGDRDASATASLGVLLLDHIRAAFAEIDSDRLPTAELLRLLVANEEGPWGRFWGAEMHRDGQPLSAATDLARKLRPFGVKPRVIRVGDETPRGYQRSDFADA